MVIQKYEHCRIVLMYFDQHFHHHVKLKLMEVLQHAYGGVSQILEDGQGHMASLRVHLLLIHGHIVLRNAKGKETHLACGLAQRYVSEGAKIIKMLL
jgi:hypothetical protein